MLHGVGFGSDWWVCKRRYFRVDDSASVERRPSPCYYLQLHCVLLVDPLDPILFWLIEYQVEGWGLTRVALARSV